MSLRFRKSIKLFPGAKINIGKTGIGVSTGIKGAHIGVNKRGVYTDVGIPGTGISSFQYIGKEQPQAAQPVPKHNRHIFLKILFFPVWLEFFIVFFLLKVTFKVIMYLISKLLARVLPDHL